MIKRELKGLCLNPVLTLALAVILLIPSIYSTLFLASMWDPYGRLSELPVAVVNEDRPVTYKGETLSVGKDLADNLKENSELDFHFVDAKTAEAGLQDTTYYMTITIPKDFSANAATVMDDQPKDMELKYKTNPGTNYIASKLATSAMEKIRASVSEEVSRTYTAAVFDGFDEIADGMDDAVKGTDDMLDGEQQLITGNSQLTTGLGTLASGSSALSDGASQLKNGISAYTQGVKSVDSGVNKMGSGVVSFKQQVSSGASELKKGSASLKEGISAYTAGVTSAKNGAAQLIANNDTLNNGMTSLSEGAAQLTSGSKELSSGLQQMQKQVGSSLSGAQSQVSDLTSSMQELGKGLSKLNQLIQSYAPTAASNTVEERDSSAQEKLNAVQGQLDELKKTELSDEQREQISAIQSKIDQIDVKTTVKKTASVKANDQALEQIKGLSGTLNSKYAELQVATGQGVEGLLTGLKDVNTALKDQLVPGASSLYTGLSELQQNVDQSLLPGVKNYTSGVSSVSTGLSTLAQKNEALQKGAGDVGTGISSLSQGIGKGSDTLQSGIKQLSKGTKELTENSGSLNAGSADLKDGADQLQSGSLALADGSRTLASGLTALQSGTSDLKDGLADGSKNVTENKANDDSIDMMANPVQLDGTEEHSVPDNGHAMAAYMMSVALWVGALAFCLMYPLTKYRGTLTSGFNWWLSKAVVLYPLAIGMALVMLLLLSKICGFEPVDWKNTIFLSCIAALAFMSLMNFFNALLGRVGSFIMLVFMIVQLAGSAGTYPIELSGDFVADINPFLPFSYTVVGFRSTISGDEVNLAPCYFMLLAIFLVFTGLSIWLFLSRAKKIKAGKHTFHDFIDSHGLA